MDKTGKSSASPIPFDSSPYSNPGTPSPFNSSSESSSTTVILAPPSLHGWPGANTEEQSHSRTDTTEVRNGTFQAPGSPHHGVYKNASAQPKNTASIEPAPTPLLAVPMPKLVGMTEAFHSPHASPHKAQIGGDRFQHIPIHPFHTLEPEDSYAPVYNLPRNVEPPPTQPPSANSTQTPTHYLVVANGTYHPVPAQVSTQQGMPSNGPVTSPPTYQQITSPPPYETYGSPMTYLGGMLPDTDASYAQPPPLNPIHWVPSSDPFSVLMPGPQPPTTEHGPNYAAKHTAAVKEQMTSKPNPIPIAQPSLPYLPSPSAAWQSPEYIPLHGTTQLPPSTPSTVPIPITGPPSQVQIAAPTVFPPPASHLSPHIQPAYVQHSGNGGQQYTPFLLQTQVPPPAHLLPLHGHSPHQPPSYQHQSHANLSLPSRSVVEPGFDGLVSMARGMENPIGANHCFVNVVIQSLYRLTEFRENLLSVTSHSHTRGSSCVFCGLQTLLNGYKYQEDGWAVDPDAFRSTLAALDAGFTKGTINDAAETLLFMLEQLHTSLTFVPPEMPPSPSVLLPTIPSGSSSVISLANPSPSASEPPTSTSSSKQAGSEVNDPCIDISKQCIVHSTLAMTFLDIADCNTCQNIHTGQVIEWIHYVPAKQVRQPWYGNFSRQPMAHLIRKSDAENDKHKCQSEACKNQERIPIKRVLQNPPPVLTIGLNWEPNPERDAITGVVRSIDEIFKLGDLFDSYDQGRTQYRLQGLISFYGLHYVTYQLMKKKDGTGVWMLFDDRRVIPVGSWHECRSNMEKAAMQPVVLWYVKTDQASK